MIILLKKNLEMKQHIIIIFSVNQLTRITIKLCLFYKKNMENIKGSFSKISSRTRHVAAATPTTPATEENNENLLETIRKIVKEELEDHQEKESEIITSQLANTNERLDKISQEDVEITKSLEFTQEELHDGLANVKNDIKKVQSDLQEIENDLLDPNFVMEKLTELEDRSQRNNV